MDHIAFEMSAEDHKVYRAWRATTVGLYCALLLACVAFLGFHAWTTRTAGPVQAAATQSNERPAEHYRSWPAIAPRQASL